MSGTNQITFVDKVLKETIAKFYKTKATPTFFYGSEMRTLTSWQSQRLEATEMCFLRRVLGVSLGENVQSDAIRKTLGVNSIVNVIKEYRGQWMNQVNRVTEDCVGLQGG